MIPLSLPGEVPSRVLRIKDYPVVQDHAAVIRAALRSPIGSKPLREIVKPGEKICLLVNDSTRVARSGLFLPYLVAELEQSGIQKKDMFIVFACGAHRAMSEEEMASLVGPEIAATLPLYNHDCSDHRGLHYLGETSRGTPVSVNRRVFEADRRILTGSIVFHFFAGFGGGRKALVPGVAGKETISNNHRLMMEPQARSGFLAGNPLHEDLLEAFRLCGGDFLFNVVLNDSQELLGVFAGDIYEAHLAGCEMVKEIYAVDIDELGDVVIASCGGYPKDINLYQAQKTLENAAAAVKTGGDLVLLAQCPEGSGSETYERWAGKYSSFEEIEKVLHDNFELGGHKAYAVARVLQKATVHLFSQLPSEKALQWGFQPIHSLDKAISRIYGSSGNKKLTYIIPQGSLTVPMLG